VTNTGLQKHRRSLLIASAAAAAGWLTGCASTRASTPREALTWTGRLGLVVESEPPQSFAGGFERLVGPTAGGGVMGSWGGGNVFMRCRPGW